MVTTQFQVRGLETDFHISPYGSWDEFGGRRYVNYENGA
jgi:hypothetical protein